MMQVNKELEPDGVSKFSLVSNVIDLEKEVAAKAKIHCQIKSWQKVRVK